MKRNTKKWLLRNPIVLHRHSSQKRFCAAACYGEVKTLTVDVKKKREIFTWRVRSIPIQCSVQYKNYYTTVYEWRDLNFSFLWTSTLKSLSADSIVFIVFFSSSSTDDYFSIENSEVNWNYLWMVNKKIS